MAKEISSDSVKDEFLEHTQDEHRQMIEYIGADDSTTRRILEKVTAKEEEHAEHLASLLIRH